jgi:hypothetical protein
MRKYVQRMPKSRDQLERKHKQHNMIKQAKGSVCVWLIKQKKLVSGRGTYSSERHVVR